LFRLTPKHSTLFLCWRADCADPDHHCQNLAWSCLGQSCCLLSSLLLDETDFGELTTMTNQ
ncbi:hypothetical protein T4E_5680, partial [Trichinella pseudospiralis]